MNRDTLHVVYHIAGMGPEWHWKQVVTEQFALLSEVGLTTVRATHVGQGLDWVRAEAERFGVEMTIVRSDTNTDHYETFAMDEIQRLAKGENTTLPILYLHTKGMSAPHHLGKLKWRKFMEHHTVRNWRWNIAQLVQHDCVGVNWMDCNWDHSCGHFSGNFWIAKAELVRRLPEFWAYHESRNRVRFSCEFWIGSGHVANPVSLACRNVNFCNDWLDWATLAPWNVKCEIVWPLALKADAISDAGRRGETSCNLKTGIAISTYVPAGAATAVRGRLPESIRSLEQTGFPGPVIIVDDGSTDLQHMEYLKLLDRAVAGEDESELNSLRGRCTVHRKPVNAGIACVKNTSMRLLMEHEVDVGFLADDDVEFRPGWWKAYLDAHERTGFHHFSWANRQLHELTEESVNGFDVVASSGLNGILLSFTPEVYRKVGGMKVLPGKYGYEHCNWTYRIVAAGLTPFLADIKYSNSLIAMTASANSSAVGKAQRDKDTAQNAFCLNVTETYLPIDEGTSAIIETPPPQNVNIFESIIAPLEPDFLNDRVNRKKMAVIVPSRGRPKNIAALCEAFHTTLATADLIVVVDDDDPQLDEYRALSLPHLRIGPRLGTGMVKPLNTTAAALRHHYHYFAFLGDDHRPRTIGWDRRFMETLDELGTGLVYGNDLWQREQLPTAVAMSGSIVHCLNGMVPPDLVHLYVDNFWLRLGRDLGAIQYLDDVVIEHLHPHAGKADWDTGYADVNSQQLYDADRDALQRYVESDSYALLLETLKNLQTCTVRSSMSCE